MKKLMVVLAAVALAGVASAANFKWTVAEFDGVSGGEDATAYLIYGNDFNQTAFLTALADGGTFASIVAAHQLDTFALDEYGEHTSAQQFTTSKVDAGGAGGVPTILNSYLAVLAGDNVYLSDIRNTAAQPSNAPVIGFGEYEPSDATKDAPITFTKGDTFSGAGWYSTVPEPTSGLLLLLGVAGLALKRKRA